METMPFTIFSRDLFKLRKHAVKNIFLKDLASGDTVRRQLFSISIFKVLEKDTLGGQIIVKLSLISETLFQQMYKKMKDVAISPQTGHFSA